MSCVSSWKGHFESYRVAKPHRQFFWWSGSFNLTWTLSSSLYKCPSTFLLENLLSFYTSCYTLSRGLWAGVHCTHRFCRMKAYKQSCKPLLGSLTCTGGDSPCTGGLQLTSLIRRTAHLHVISVIPANDTKESMFGHQNFSSPAVGIEPMTSSNKGQCTNH